MCRSTCLGSHGQTRQPQHGEHVRVVPLERYRKREDVELGHGRLGLDRDQAHARRDLRGELLLGRQEHALAHDVRFLVEQLVDGLQPQVRHPDEIGVRERQRDAQPSAVRFADVAHLFREDLAGVLTLLPMLHQRPLERTFEVQSGPFRWNGPKIVGRAPDIARSPSVETVQ